MYFIKISLVAAGRKDLKGAEIGEESRVILRSVLDKWCHSPRREWPENERLLQYLQMKKLGIRMSILKY